MKMLIGISIIIIGVIITVIFAAEHQPGITEAQKRQIKAMQSSIDAKDRTIVSLEKQIQILEQKK